MARIPQHQTVALTTHATEYSIAIPAAAGNVSFQVREGDTALKYYFSSTGGNPTGGKYLTLQAGASKQISGVVGAFTLYVQAVTNDGKNLEVEYTTEI